MTRHWCRIDKSINVRRECAYEFVRSLEMTKAHTPVATACIRMQRTVRYMRGFFIIESEIESERWADVQSGRVCVCVGGRTNGQRGALSAVEKFHWMVARCVCV